MSSSAPGADRGEALEGALPRPATPLLGREREVAQVLALLRGAARLVTLTGAGGSGKTRLALHCAAQLAGAVPRIAWVPLAAVRDAALVPASIGRALGLPVGESVTERLVPALLGEETLLVLDNYEHLLEAATVPAQLLAACPELRILATSRAPLRLTAEHELPVGPLELPPLVRPRGPAAASPAADPAVVAASPAVQLFLQRVRAVRPDFTLTAENAPVVAEICARLDGLPLAIELGAARARVLTPSALLANLARRLALLSGGSRDLPARQRTLRATLDWSHSLLSAPARALFARLGMLVGEWGLDEAAAVGLSAEEARPVTAPTGGVLETLTELAEMSLVVRRDADASAPDAQPRFAMLETVREYALERLAELGEESAVRRRHAAHFLALAREAEPHLRGPDQARWLDRLAAHHANLSAATRWWTERAVGGDATRAAGDAAGAGPDSLLSGLRMAAALWRYWWVRGHLAEGRMLAAALLELPVPPLAVDVVDVTALSALRAEVTFGAGVMACLTGDFPTAHALHRLAHDLWQDVGDEEGVAYAIENLGEVEVAFGRLEEGQRLLEDAVARFRALGDARGVAWPLAALGLIRLLMGDTVEASTALEESLSSCRASGDALGEAQALDFLAFVRLDAGDLDAADRIIAESLTLHRRLGEQSTVAQPLEAAALLAARRGDHAAAARLVADAAARREEIGSAEIPPLRAFLDARHAAAGPSSAGTGEAGGDGARGGQAASPPGPLTAREDEVAALVADGLSNRQIGERLIITPGTAGVHVTHILNKLGFQSRAQIAAWAVQRGLVH